MGIITAVCDYPKKGNDNNVDEKEEDSDQEKSKLYIIHLITISPLLLLDSL